MKACKSTGKALQFAHKNHKADKEVVMMAVRNEKQGRALRYAATDLKVDKDVLYASQKCVALVKVRENGEALGGPEVAPEMRDDKDVVLAAMTQNVDALEYASEALCSDADVMISAIRRDGDAMYYASDSLKADRLFVLDGKCSSNLTVACVFWYRSV